MELLARHMPLLTVGVAYWRHSRGKQRKPSYKQFPRHILACRCRTCGCVTVRPIGMQDVLSMPAYRDEEPGPAPSPLYVAPKDRLNMRILQDMISGIPSYFVSKPEREILVFVWSFGPLSQSQPESSPQDRAKLDGMYECILCACCMTSCPSYWWPSPVP